MLHVIDALGGGGAETALAYLLPAMPRCGIECEVAALHPPYEVSALLESAGITVHRLGGESRGFGRSTPPLHRLLSRRRYDLVHAHLMEASFSVALASAVTRTPSVVLFHNLAFEAYPPKSLKSRMRLLAESMWTRAGYRAWVGVSTAVAEHYREWLRLPLVDVIPNAVAPADPALLTPASRAEARSEFGLPLDEPLLLMAARFRPEKGHSVLLSALKILEARQQCPHVVLVGDGPLYEDIREAVQLARLEDRVTLTGALPHRAVLHLLGAADLVVLPSSSEGMGVAAVEGMIYGKAVIATRTGGLSDVISDESLGILVAPDDPPALAAALEEALTNDELRARLGWEAARVAERRYSPDTVAARWSTLYEALTH